MMSQTINVLRYSSATTKKALLAEIANADSKDYGVGANYGGLCVRVESGQEFVPTPLIDAQYTTGYKFDLDSVQSSAAWLEADIETQGICESRKMWRITVDRADIVGLTDRTMGGLVRIYFADRVILRRGANVLKVEAVR